MHNSLLLLASADLARSRFDQHIPGPVELLYWDQYSYRSDHDVNTDACTRGSDDPSSRHSVLNRYEYI